MLQDRVFAVLDDAVAADRAHAALISAGVAPHDIARFEGSTAADEFDGTGRVHGVLGRLRRVVEFSLMDQMPDLAWYEAALRDGRIVLGVRTSGSGATRRAVDGLLGAGAHFINRFGRLQTEELARWRGPEPAVPGLLRR